MIQVPDSRAPQPPVRQQRQPERGGEGGHPQGGDGGRIAEGGTVQGTQQLYYPLNLNYLLYTDMK